MPDPLAEALWNMGYNAVDGPTWDNEEVAALRAALAEQGYVIVDAEMLAGALAAFETYSEDDAAASTAYASAQDHAAAIIAALPKP